MSKFHLLFFVISLFRVLVRADYTIDDSNYSVLKFSENPAGPVWGPFGSDTGEVLEIRLPNGTMQTVDATQCYDGTYTYAACSASNKCAVQFTFTGSGLTIYVLQAGPQGMSASLSIDSGTPTTATLGAPSPPQYYVPRVVLFNVQNIPSGTHTAVMTVQDWNGGFSGMMLDYINVNQAEVSGPTTNPNPSPNPSPSPSPNPSPTPSSPPAQSPSSTPATNSQGTQQTSLTGTQTNSASVASVAILSVLSSQSSGVTALPSSTPSGNGTSSTVSSSSGSKKTNLAAIVGGVVGGVVGLLALLALAFFCFRRRRQQLETLNERPSPLLPVPEARFTNFGAVGADPFASSTALSVTQPSGTSRPLQTWTDSEAGSTPNFAARDASNITNLSHTRGASSGNDSAASSAPAAVPISYSNEKSVLAAGSTPQQNQTANLDAPSARPNAVLTDDQADFVNSLFNNNVPAPVVARVLERMLANPQGANSTGYNDPELRSHFNPGNLSSQVQAPAGGAPWQPTMSDIVDGETTIGTAPPSYDYVQAQ